MEAAAGFAATVWRERDTLTGASWEESSAATGYLYQILVQLIDKSGDKVTLDDRKIKVQIQGNGQGGYPGIFEALCGRERSGKHLCTSRGKVMTPRLLKKSVKRIPQDNQVIKSDSCGIF